MALAVAETLKILPKHLKASGVKSNQDQGVTSVYVYSTGAVAGVSINLQLRPSFKQAVIEGFHLHMLVYIC